jgi:uncharacterized protein (TIGR03067 family)
MANAILEHPSADQLTAFGLGRLPRAEIVEIERHVADCDTCRQALETLPDDSLIMNLRNPACDDAGKLHDVATQTHAPQRAQVSTEIPPELRDHPRYRVQELLGVGGMGAVFKAEHLLMKRPVALKVINPQLVANANAVERFRREVVAAGTLTHPNIVHAYDAEQAGDTHFLVMEHVEGISLAKLVSEQGPLPVAQACDFIRQAALGLQHAHERGMVHRDIKPQNLMVVPQSRDRQGADTAALPDGRGSDRGVIKILDFGLARFSLECAAPASTNVDAGQPTLAPGETPPAHAPSLTLDGAVMGTPDYIAPEQVRDAHTADIRADIYSLGCTLYDLLTGKPPFPEGTAMQKVIGHLERTPQPLGEVRPGVPTELVQVVAKMMAKDPAERYQTPAEAAEAVAPFAVPDRSAGGPPATTLRAGGPTARRKRRRLRFALAVSAVIIALSAIAYTFIPPVQDFAQTVIRITTNKGELVIEADDEDIEIVVKQAGKEPRIEVIQKTSKRTFVLTATDGEIVAQEKESGLRVKTTEFQLTRGGQVKLNAHMLLAAKPEPGFRPLFNGKDLTGWVAVNPPDMPRGAVPWSVVEGALTCGENGERSVLHTAKAYENYALELEFRFPKHVDWDTLATGFLLHLNDPKGKEPRAHELVLATRRLVFGSLGRVGVLGGLDQLGGAEGGGVFADIATLTHGKWHQLKVVCDQDAMEVFVNGKWQCRVKAYEPTKGFIALQHRNPGVQVRNINLKELTSPAQPTNQERIQGHWVAVYREFGGKTQSERELGRLPIFEFAGNRLSYLYPDWTAEHLFKLGPTKTPKEIEIQLMDRQGGIVIERGFQNGTFHFEGDTLKLAMSPATERRPTVFASNAGSPKTVLVLRRVEPTRLKELIHLAKKHALSQVNLRQIGLAFHDYLDARRRFPPQAICGTDGKPLLSWRVAILEFLPKGPELYKQFKLNEPWDSAHNVKLLEQIPDFYRPVTGASVKPGSTYYQVFTGPNTLYPKPASAPRLGQIADGSSNTFLVVDAASAVPWTKPDDLPYDPKKDLSKLGGSFEDGFYAAMCDGRASFIPRETAANVLHALVTPAGEEKFDDDFGPRDPFVVRPATPKPETQKPTEEPAFQPLFNGKDLAGWISADKGWTVSDQVLSNKGHPTAFLRTEKAYENYLLSADFRCPEPFPSQQTTGLLVHVQKTGDPRTPAYVIPLVNPFSGAVVVRGDAKAKWDEVRASWRPRPESAWNQLRVRCQGDVIELSINGELIGRLTNCDLKSGFIAFHAQNNVLELRNIQIHQLPAPVQSR